MFLTLIELRIEPSKYTRDKMMLPGIQRILGSQYVMANRIVPNAGERPHTLIPFHGKVGKKPLESASDPSAEQTRPIASRALLEKFSSG
jgi:hypothetical protein